MSAALQVTGLREETKKRNLEVKKLAGENRKALAEMKELYAKAADSKKKRDECNEKVKELNANRKHLRERQASAEKDLKGLEGQWEKLGFEGKHSATALKKIIDELEWQLQTEGLSSRQEKELSMQIKGLEQERRKAEKAEPLVKRMYELRKALSGLRAESRALDASFRLCARDGKRHHDDTMRFYRRADGLKTEVRKHFGEIDEKARQADETYRKFAEARKKEYEHISKVRKENKESEARRKKEVEGRKLSKHQRQQNLINEKAKKIFDSFKHGKKLTLDDLKVLQEAGLDV